MKYLYICVVNIYLCSFDEQARSKIQETNFTRAQ